MRHLPTNLLALFAASPKGASDGAAFQIENGRWKKVRLWKFVRYYRSGASRIAIQWTSQQDELSGLATRNGGSRQMAGCHLRGAGERRDQGGNGGGGSLGWQGSEKDRRLDAWQGFRRLLTRRLRRAGGAAHSRRLAARPLRPVGLDSVLSRGSQGSITSRSQVRRPYARALRVRRRVREPPT
jgi:hypothetical protein